MKGESQINAQFVLKCIYRNIWDGVAVQNIRKIAPTAAKMEALQFLHSHITNELPNRTQNCEYSQEKYAKNIEIDNLAVASTQIEHDQNNSKRERKSSNVSSQIRQHKFTTESFMSKKPTQPRKTLQQFTDKKQQSKLIEIDFDDNAHVVFDQQENRVRDLKFNGEKYDAELKIAAIEKEKERQESKKVSAKMFKDIKKFTFDYMGKFVSIGNRDLGAEKPVKLNKKDGRNIIESKNDKNPEQTVIETNKSKQKGERKIIKGDNSPTFNKDCPESLLDVVKDETDISQGVKFIAKKGSQNIVKQKKRKALSGIKKYRLSQFQNLAKDTKFKQFKSKNLNSISSATIDVNKIQQNPPNEKQQQKKPLISIQKEQKREKKSNSNSQQVLKMDKNSNKFQNYFILPPLRNKMFSKKSAYSNSHRTIQISHSNSHTTHISKINIDDENLFETNFIKLE